MPTAAKPTIGQKKSLRRFISIPDFARSRLTSSLGPCHFVLPFPRLCQCLTLRKVASVEYDSRNGGADARNRPDARSQRVETMMADGILHLAPHQLASLVTYLVHDLGEIPAEIPLSGGLRFEQIGSEGLARYRALFRAVGAPWLWFSRLRLDDAELGALLASPDIECLALAGNAGDIGLLELDFRQAHAELAFLGLVPDAVGAGLGRSLMATALVRAKAAGAAGLHVHTCSLDHPRALEFYGRAGFRVVRRAIEIFDDPRLDGTLPRDVAAQVPLIAGELGSPAQDGSNPS
jgi:ribosomal protein S18 acetylase RimI-like enzyme